MKRMIAAMRKTEILSVAAIDGLEVRRTMCDSMLLQQPTLK